MNALVANVAHWGYVRKYCVEHYSVPQSVLICDNSTWPYLNALLEIAGWSSDSVIVVKYFKAVIRLHLHFQVF